MPNYISPPPQSPLTRVMTSIVAVLVLAGAFMISMVALLVVVGVGLLAACAIWLRVAWIRRSLRKGHAEPGNSADPAMSASDKGDGQVIDAEYTVISKLKD